MAIWRWGRLAVEYAVEVRPRRRRAALVVEAGGRVRVLLPPTVPPEAVPDLLAAHAQWLAARVEALRALAPAPVLGDGARLWWLGTPLVVRLAEVAPQRGVRRHAGVLWVPAASGRGPRLRRALKRWYLREGAPLLAERMAHWGRALQAPPHRLKIRELAGRWGFCRRDGLVVLDFRLVQAPLAVVDYVVVHELTHLRFFHHRADFQAALRAALAEADAARAWLERQGGALRW